MKIGYLRVSTEEQKPDRQLDALKPVCDKLYLERLSAVAPSRPVYDQVLAELKSGDTLVVWDLDRAFRSTIDAILQAEALRERGISFKIMTLNVDTTEPAGEFFYTIMAAYAQFERRNLSKRTKEGLAAARRRGKRLGRPPKMSKRQLINAKNRLEQEDADHNQLAQQYGVHPYTLKRAIKRLENMV